MNQAIGQAKSLFRAGVWMVLGAGLIQGAVMTSAHAADTAGAQATAPATGEAAAAPAARWVERKFNYTYMGFTTHYSCDGLRDNVRDVLLALGARKSDLKVRSMGCTKLVGPEPFPGVSARFWVLAPASADDAGKTAETAALPTQWHRVDLVRMPQFTFDRGQCELLEQLKKKALPLFTTRNLNFRSSCVPHQVSVGDIQFIVDVLRAAPAAADAPAPAT